MSHTTVAFGFLLGLVFCQEAAAGKPGQDGEAVEIMREIQLLNLINGLELDRGQIEFILQEAQEAERLGEEFGRELRKLEQESVMVLKDLREVRALDRGVSADLKRRVHEAKNALEQLKLEHEASVSALSAGIRQQLHGHQLYALEHYKPCLIPPGGASRIGQAEDSEGVLKKLEAVRRMPVQVFEKRKAKLAEEAVKRLRKHLPKGFVIDEEEERKRILSLLEEARGLPDADYALNKAGMVEKLKSRYALPKLPLDISVKIEKFLLCKEIIPLLRERLARMEGGNPKR